VKVFVSSFITGMEPIRAAVVSAVRALGHEPITAEKFGTRPESPQVACLSGVRESDCVVLVLGTRYGAVQPSGSSATQEEFREARDRRPILVFISDEPDREPAQRAFVAEVQSWQGGQFTEQFASAEELRSAVTRALHRWELSRDTIRHSLKSFGVKLNKVGRAKFDQAVRDASADDPLTAELMDCMLNARAALWREYLKLHEMVIRIVARHELCRRYMRIPGVGPITALTFVTAVDDPARFKRSRNVAAYFGLTSKRWQSGSSIDVKGRISKAGDPDVRRCLYEAASAMLTRYRGATALKTWGQKIAKRCHKKGVVAVARKLSVIMHAMWRDGSEYADQPVAHDRTETRRPRDKDRKLLGAYA